MSRRRRQQRQPQRQNQCLVTRRSCTKWCFKNKGYYYFMEALFVRGSTVYGDAMCTEWEGADFRSETYGFLGLCNFLEIVATVLSEERNFLGLYVLLWGGLCYVEVGILDENRCLTTPHSCTKGNAQDEGFSCNKGCMGLLFLRVTLSRGCLCGDEETRRFFPRKTIFCRPLLLIIDGITIRILDVSTCLMTQPNCTKCTFKKKLTSCHANKIVR